MRQSLAASGVIRDDNTGKDELIPAGYGLGLNWGKS